MPTLHGRSSESESGSGPPTLALATAIPIAIFILILVSCLVVFKRRRTRREEWKGLGLKPSTAWREWNGDGGPSLHAMPVGPKIHPPPPSYSNELPIGEGVKVPERALGGEMKD